MQVEVGKSYFTRDGGKVTIIDRDKDDTFPFDGNNEHCYTVDGRVWTKREHPQDLISLFKEPTEPEFSKDEFCFWLLGVMQGAMDHAEDGLDGDTTRLIFEQLHGTLELEDGE